MLSYHWKSTKTFSKSSTFFLCIDVFQNVLLHLYLQKDTYDMDIYSFMYVIQHCFAIPQKYTLKTSKSYSCSNVLVSPPKVQTTQIVFAKVSDPLYRRGGPEGRGGGPGGVGHKEMSSILADQ